MRTPHKRKRAPINVGSSVLTPDGTGVVVEVISTEYRLGSKPRQKVWILVELDSGRRHHYLPEHLNAW